MPPAWRRTGRRPARPANVPTRQADGRIDRKTIEHRAAPHPEATIPQPRIAAEHCPTAPPRELEAPPVGGVPYVKVQDVVTDSPAKKLVLEPWRDDDGKTRLNRTVTLFSYLGFLTRRGQTTHPCDKGYRYYSNRN